MKSTKSANHSFVIGQAVFIRTVTHYYTGCVASVTDSDVGLDNAAWIADTGRFADAFKSGFNEVEPYPVRVYVCRGAIVDFCEWSLELPRKQK